jgi:glycerophosphoryl diester phosphodiesterase
VTKVIAHRGASAARPENTVEAFVHARTLGADGVELDVRRTSDGHGAVHHDPVLADGRLIVELDSSALPDGVVTLPAALDACVGMEINVEIKNVAIDPDFDPAQTMARYVADTVSDMGLVDQVVVSSFGIDAINAVKAHQPRLRTAWLVFQHPDPPALVDRAQRAGHDGIHPLWAMVDQALVRAAHDAGLFVNVWTVDDPVEMRRLADLGVDGIVTNVPDVALAALDRR